MLAWPTIYGRGLLAGPDWTEGAVMASLPHLDAEAVSSTLPWPAAIDAVARAVGAFDAGANPPRTSVALPVGEFLLMSAATTTAAGVKVLSIAPANSVLGLPRIQGLYLLFDAATLTPRALLDGAALTTLRTPAVSAFAVRELAAPAASKLTVFGAGPQAEAHVHAINSVRPLETVSIVGRDADRSATLVDRLIGAGVPARSGTSHDVADADIVVCATTARTPLFDGDLLAAHACVVAVGSHEPSARELGDAVFRRAGHVIVEDVPTALREAGDVISAIAAGVLDPDQLVGLNQIQRVRPSTRLSIFKSVGMGWQDLAIAEALVAAWLNATGPVPIGRTDSP
jgi:ornithine cyclodeaminase/alanine dehydrogenase-like protein (mu-crystallin family)